MGHANEIKQEFRNAMNNIQSQYFFMDDKIGTNLSLASSQLMPDVGVIAGKDHLHMIHDLKCSLTSRVFYVWKQDVCQCPI